MSLPTCLKQCIEYSTAHTEIRIHAYPDSCCNLIRCPESDSINIICQAVWIFPDNTVNILSICLIYFNRKVHCDSILLQKDHRLTQIPFFIHLTGNLHCFPATDSFDLRKTFRLFLYDPESILLKTSDNPRSHGKSDSFDRPGTKIPLDCLFILRCFLLKTCHLKLLSIGRMLCILSLCLNIFSFCNRRKYPYAGDLIFSAYQI